MITFTITFHGPFRVGTGTPSEGLDARVDRDNLLPSTSLKGVMRAAAKETLAAPVALVDAVFGGPAGRRPGTASASPWGWTDALFSSAPIVTPVTRIRVDNATGLVRPGALMFGEHVWATTATFEVFPIATLSDAELRRHCMLLGAAGRAVTSVGALRRRGEGWVTIVDDLDWAAGDVARLMEEVAQ